MFNVFRRHPTLLGNRCDMAYAMWLLDRNVERFGPIEIRTVEAIKRGTVFMYATGETNRPPRVLKLYNVKEDDHGRAAD